jgi:hypothetical protein
VGRAEKRGGPGAVVTAGKAALIRVAGRCPDVVDKAERLLELRVSAAALADRNRRRGPGLGAERLHGRGNFSVMSV